MIYCDNAATSFPKPPVVIEAMRAALSDFSGSPGRSAHKYALAAGRTVFAARENLADLFGLPDSSRVVFTLNVTQALNVALWGLLQPGDHVLTTCLEHNAVMRPLSQLAERLGITHDLAGLDDSGRVDPEDFKRKRKKNTRLAVVNHGSNVSGVIAPLQEIKSALGDVPLVVDAAQTAGALPASPLEMGVDVWAFTGHKALFGPTGTGGLWVGPNVELAPVFTGGTGSRSERVVHPEFMPDRLEAGTPNTHGLAGLAASAAFLREVGLKAIRGHETELIRIFLDGLGRIPAARVLGGLNPADRLAVVSLNLEGWSPSDLAGALDREYGIMIRPGLHCAPQAHQTYQTAPKGAARFSFGWFNTREEVNEVLTALDRLARKKA